DVPPPDVVICVVDADNLERNLYLVSQVLELGRPAVVALTMMDLAQARGLTIDLDRLGRQLGVAVVAVQAHRPIGLDTLKATLSDVAGQPARVPESPFPGAFKNEVSRLGEALSSSRCAECQPSGRAGEPLPRYLVERLLLDTGGYVEGRFLGNGV